MEVRKGFKYDLLNQENDMGEWEPKFVEGVGWAIYQVEANAGTITLWITKKELNRPPEENDDIIAQCKVCYYGSFGTEEGAGCFYENPELGTYQKKTEFKNFLESEYEVDKWLIKQERS